MPLVNGKGERLVAAKSDRSANSANGADYRWRKEFEKKDAAKKVRMSALQRLAKNRENRGTSLVLDSQPEGENHSEDEEASSGTDALDTSLSPPRASGRSDPWDPTISPAATRSKKRIRAGIAVEARARALLATVSSRSAAKSTVEQLAKLSRAKSTATNSGSKLVPCEPRVVAAEHNHDTAKRKPAVVEPKASAKRTARQAQLTAPEDCSLSPAPKKTKTTKTLLSSTIAPNTSTKTRPVARHRVKPSTSATHRKGIARPVDRGINVLVKNNTISTSKNPLGIEESRRKGMAHRTNREINPTVGKNVTKTSAMASNAGESVSARLRNHHVRGALTVLRSLARQKVWRAPAKSMKEGLGDSNDKVCMPRPTEPANRYKLTKSKRRSTN